MNDTSLLALPPPPKPKSAALAELLPQIESALLSGHSHTTIHQYICAKLGLDITFGYYQLTVHRERKKRSSVVRSTQKLSMPVKIHTAKLPTPEAMLSADTPKFEYDVYRPIDDFFQKGLFA